MWRSVWNVAPPTARPKGSPARSTAILQAAADGLDRPLPVLDDVGVGALPGVAENHAELLADGDHLRSLAASSPSCGDGR